jgi:transcriptional regulator with XRE-family HTH domain
MSNNLMVFTDKIYVNTYTLSGKYGNLFIMGRKLKNASGQDKSPSRFKVLCGTYRLNYENGPLSMVEFAEKLGGYKQSTLSQIENKEEGPPIELVKKYADFFKLEREKRFDFFLAALEASNKLEINCRKISPIFKDNLLKFLSFILSDQTAGLILQAKQVDPQYFLDGRCRNNHNNLDETWVKLNNFFADFIKKGIEEINDLPGSVLSKIIPH